MNYPVIGRARAVRMAAAGALALALGTTVVSARADGSTAAGAAVEAAPCPSMSDATRAGLARMRRALATPGAKFEFPSPPPPEFIEVRRLEDQRLRTDWAYLCRYRDENAAAGPGRPTAVFLGDSITENWREMSPAFFEAHHYVGRGIGGQTTPQMLVRFQADVVALRPRVVHLMAGTNDVAGNLGQTRDEDVQNNIRAMVSIARANGIRVVLGSIPPAAEFAWSPGLQPAARIVRLNAWLEGFARQSGIVYVDYHTALRDASGGFRQSLANDGVHPNVDGYAVMEPLATRAITEALRRH